MASSTTNRILVVLAALLAPVFAGGIIYYSLKRTHPDLAHLGNWMSFVAFFFWPVVVRIGNFQFGKAVPLLVVALGIVLAMIAVRRIRRTGPRLTGYLPLADRS